MRTSTICWSHRPRTDARVARYVSKITNIAVLLGSTRMILQALKFKREKSGHLVVKNAREVQVTTWEVRVPATAAQEIMFLTLRGTAHCRRQTK